MSESNALAVPEKVRASSQLAVLLGMEVSSMLDTIKAQCFKCPANQVTDAQLAAFVSIANEMAVNPLLPGMLYAYPVQGGGIVPIMGPDGVFKKLAERPDVDSWEATIHPEDAAQLPTHAVARIFRKGVEKPLKYTAYLSEWKINSNPNWNTRPRHMLTIRAIKQCARQIIHGIPFDEDERHIMGEINVTHSAEQTAGDPPATDTPKRPGRPAKSTKGAAAAMETQDKAAQPPIDVATTTTPPAEPKKPAAPAEKPTEQAKTPPTPVTALAAGDRQTFAPCEVLELTGKQLSSPQGPKLTVIIALRGAFEGTVYDTRPGSAAWIDDKDPSKGMKVMPPWQLEKPMRITLVGKLRRDETVACIVESAEVMEDSAQQAEEVP